VEAKLTSSIFLIATVTSLDSNTTQVLVPYATSSFNTHSLLSVIGIVSGVMIAVVKAPMAKIGDVFGRMEAFMLSVLLYVAGYIQMAASSNVETYAVCKNDLSFLHVRVPLYSTLQD
jgi:MFS family permease